MGHEKTCTKVLLISEISSSRPAKWEENLEYKFLVLNYYFRTQYSNLNCVRKCLSATLHIRFNGDLKLIDGSGLRG